MVGAGMPARWRLPDWDANRRSGACPGAPLRRLSSFPWRGAATLKARGVSLKANGLAISPARARRSAPVQAGDASGFPFSTTYVIRSLVFVLLGLPPA